MSKHQHKRKKIHRIVAQKSEEGELIVIIGNCEHPEVQGICGWSKTPPVVIETHEEAENFVAEKGQKICIVSQTTFNYNKFQDLVAIVSRPETLLSFLYYRLVQY